MNIKSILRDNNFQFNKGYGQNFLTDDHILSAIVESSGITSSDTVIEVGCGAGTLTRHIAKVAKKVVCYEIDTNLKKVLDITLADCDNVEVVFADIMSMDMESIESKVGDSYKVVANIPYYITSPLIMKFVEESSRVDSLTLTIQKEVADRLCASPATKDYGAITVSIDIVGDCSMQQFLPRELFYPSPNVDSAVVRVDVCRDKYNIINMPLLKKLIKCGFAMRRKTLVNNLMSTFGLGREQCQQLLMRCELDIQARGETLSSKDYVMLAEMLTAVID